MATPTTSSGHTFPDVTKTKWLIKLLVIMGSVLTSCSTILASVSVTRRGNETNFSSAYILQMSEDTVLDWARLGTIERVKRACILPPTRKPDPVVATVIALSVI